MVEPVAKQLDKMIDQDIAQVKRDPREIIEGATRLRTRAYFQTMGISLLSILIFGSIGFFLDMYFGSKPKIFVVSIAVSFFVTQFVLYKFFKKISTKQ